MTQDERDNLKVGDWIRRCISTYQIVGFRKNSIHDELHQKHEETDHLIVVKNIDHCRVDDPNSNAICITDEENGKNPVRLEFVPDKEFAVDVSLVFEGEVIVDGNRIKTLAEAKEYVKKLFHGVLHDVGDPTDENFKRWDIDCHSKTIVDFN